VSKIKKVITGAGVAIFAIIALFVGMYDVASDSIQFDLRIIGESIYEAQAKSGKWPAQIADLEGTAYLRMPYRRGGLEKGTYVMVWQQDLDPKPAANRDRVLAYSNGGLLPWLGLVWACRGDLRTERITKGEILALQELPSSAQEEGHQDWSRDPGKVAKPH
jgi:hypothetical protein